MRYRVTLYVFPPGSTASWAYDVVLRETRFPLLNNKGLTTRQLCASATAYALQEFERKAHGDIDPHIMPTVSVDGGHKLAQFIHKFGKES